MDLKSKANRRLQKAKDKIRAKYGKEMKQAAEQVFEQYDFSGICDIKLIHNTGKSSSVMTNIPYNATSKVNGKIKAAQQPILDKIQVEMEPLDDAYDKWELELINATNTEEITLPDF